MGANCCGARERSIHLKGPPPVSPGRFHLGAEDGQSTTCAEQTPVATLASPRRSPRRKVSIAARHAVIHFQDEDVLLQDYQAASKDEQRMTEFLRHFVVMRGGCVEGEQADAALVKLAQLHCSGQTMATFQMLREQVDSAPWAQPARNGMTNQRDRTLTSWYDSDAPNEATAKERSLSAWYADDATEPGMGTHPGESNWSAQEHDIFSRRCSNASQHQFHDIFSRRGSHASVTPEIIAYDGSLEHAVERHFGKQ
eukprot:TRINITY_DN108542_c0_g1_i1.p1 TRINITY_DN108542_c0_g1~~TRINITY_DN108542_c0_g1_i1.p1  ORF type:complete len:254 (+),score=39.85 TRINITY_DN108542_c0_g1_i1:36-797(+)